MLRCRWTSDSINILNPDSFTLFTFPRLNIFLKDDERHYKGFHHVIFKKTSGYVFLCKILTRKVIDHFMVAALEKLFHLQERKRSSRSLKLRMLLTRFCYSLSDWLHWLCWLVLVLLIVPACLLFPSSCCFTFIFLTHVTWSLSWNKLRTKGFFSYVRFSHQILVFFPPPPLLHQLLFVLCRTCMYDEIAFL